jgi:hypothetical protein
MRKILIISPHYPPSNLAAVHRSRLFAMHLPSFGWEPIILTVHEKFYEEGLDWNLHQLVPQEQRIEKVTALKVTKPRLIGDIGLRSFFQLRKRALDLVQKENIDFVYIPIPSFYVSLIGQYLLKKTGVKFGIDYIDPWVHSFPGSDKKFSRHWWSTKLAKWLEPIAVTNASLITGVSEGYYQGVIDRNPNLSIKCLFGSMPYGGERTDHQVVEKLKILPYLFKKNKKLQFVYAGALLPKAFSVLESVFQSLQKYNTEFSEVEFHFIGTGKSPNDLGGYAVKPYAEKYGLWQTLIFEYPQRIPYLDVLVHLNVADAVFILGSTEPHYTPSKTYQGVLSKKPIMAVLHTKSSAVGIIRHANAGKVFDINGEKDLPLVADQFLDFFRSFKGFFNTYSAENIDMQYFEQYTAFHTTKVLSDLLDQAIQS